MEKLEPQVMIDYQGLAKKIRREILDLIYRTKGPHIGSCFSCVEILLALYFHVLNINTENPGDPLRDRFILSKGHACPAFYAVLQERGFMDEETLEGFAVNNGLLEQHPTRDINKGIEASTGSLGHGLALGAGMALAAQHDGLNFKVYVLLSDGELQEGSTWEAVMFAAHHKLENLIAIVDYNKIQALGRVEEVINLEPLADRWRAFGWGVKEIDGHDFEHLIAALEKAPFEEHKPSVLIAHTVKGKGVSFMEDKLLWHYRCPDEKEYLSAKEELT